MSKPDASDETILSLVAERARKRVADIRRGSPKGTDPNLVSAREGRGVNGMSGDILSIMERHCSDEERWGTLVDACEAAYKSAAKEAAT